MPHRPPLNCPLLQYSVDTFQWIASTPKDREKVLKRGPPFRIPGHQFYPTSSPQPLIAISCHSGIDPQNGMGQIKKQSIHISELRPTTHLESFNLSRFASASRGPQVWRLIFETCSGRLYPPPRRTGLISPRTGFLLFSFSQLVATRLKEGRKTLNRLKCRHHITSTEWLELMR